MEFKLNGMTFRTTPGPGDQAPQWARDEAAEEAAKETEARLPAHDPSKNNTPYREGVIYNARFHDGSTAQFKVDEYGKMTRYDFVPRSEQPGVLEVLDWRTGSSAPATGRDSWKPGDPVHGYSQGGLRQTNMSFSGPVTPEKYHGPDGYVVDKTPSKAYQPTPFGGNYGWAPSGAGLVGFGGVIGY